MRHPYAWMLLAAVIAFVVRLVAPDEPREQDEWL